MSFYGGRKCSLIEQKKQQWAKEKEELAHLSTPWGRTYTKLDKTLLRARNLAKHSNSEVTLHREDYARNLPPISRKNYDPDHYEVEGDTSGYASDSAKENGPEYYVTSRNRKQHENCQVWMSNWNHRSSESDVSVSRDDRLKWGDRGLGVGHLWDPDTNDNPDKATDPPGWLQRGLKSDKEVVVVSQSPDQTGESSTDRPFTGESTNTNMNSILRTHLRGQNIPLEPGEAEERERKRQKALELQNAIKQQLEEREIKRKLERERQLREEMEEESRIRREQEVERQRVEEEHKMINEKKERERMRNQAMKEAIESAEKAAKLEKSKHKNIRTKSNVLNLPEVEPEIKRELKVSEEKSPLPLVISPRTVSRIANEPRSPMNNIILEDNKQSLPVVNRLHEAPPKAILESNNSEQKIDNPIKLQDNLVNQENVTLYLQNPFDTFQGMQLALLVPTAAVNVSGALPMAVPVSAGNEQPSITENRVLTPSVYRLKNKNCRESSTQTENTYFNRPESGKKEDNYGSLDRRRSINGSGRNERRMRSEERAKEGSSEKPKWGVNRPPMRYLKQSEKDPVYQKRKMRQKSRETIFEDKNNNYTQSSDDSSPQTPDHRAYRKPNYNRSMWHKNERLFSQNISVYQTEIVPLDLDKQGRVYVKDTDYKETTRLGLRPKYRDSTPESSRRSDRYTPRSGGRKERVNDGKKSMEKEDSFEATENEDGILNQISSLRNGMMLKQQQWDDDHSGTRARSGIEFPSVHDNP